MCWGLRLTGWFSKSTHADALRRENGDFAIAEKENAARVRENCGNVAGDEKFILAEADDDRRPQSRGDDLLRIARGEGHQRVRTAHHLDRLQDRLFERCVL